jgi:hypothetical protein
MRISFLLLILLLSFCGFGQTRKPAPVVYKTLQSESFETGDHIRMGTISTSAVSQKYRQFTVQLPDSLEAFRDFVFAHPEMEYKITVKWQQSGRKFPAETGAVTDSLLRYFRMPPGSVDNRQYINEVHHVFLKQDQRILLELEITGGTSPLLANAGKKGSPFIQPENQILYKKYKNEILIDTAFIPASHSIWVEGERMYIQYPSRGKAILQVKPTKAKERTLHLFSGTREERASHGVYVFEVRDLPEPELFFAGKSLEGGNIGIPDLLSADGTYTAGYTTEVPLKANYSVVEVRYLIAGKEYAHTGNKISKKVRKALEEAPAGSEILIRKIAVNGNRRVKYNNVLNVVK